MQTINIKSLFSRQIDLLLYIIEMASATKLNDALKALEQLKTRE